MKLAKFLFIAPLLLSKVAIASPVDLTSMQLNDGAYINTSGELVLTLNGALPGGDGAVPGATSAFIATPFSNSSSTTFQAMFQFRQNGSADGLTFIVHNDPRGASAIGAGGNSMGVDGGTGGTPAPISPSYAVEFDLYPSLSEIGILLNGNATQTEEIAAASSPVPLGTGASYTAWIEHDGQTLSAYVSDTDIKPLSPVVSALLPLTDLGTSVYFGFTGARGGFGSDQFIENFDLTVNSSPDAVPLPAAAPLLAGGVGLLGIVGWRRRRVAGLERIAAC